MDANYLLIIKEIYSKYNKENVSDISKLLEQHKGTEKELIQSLFLKYSANPIDFDFFKKYIDTNFKEFLSAFYSKHNPDKLKEVDNLVEKFKGKKDVFINQLCSRYNLQPCSLLDYIDIQKNENDTKLIPENRKEIILKTRKLELDEQGVNEITEVQLDKTPQIKVKKASKKRTIFLIVGSLLIFLIISIVIYFNIYIPWRIEKNAPRMYVLPGILNLRNSQSTTSDGNIIKKIPYGSEVVVYTLDSNWATVRVGENKGFMGFPYKFLVDKKTFIEIDAIFGNQEARELVSTSYLKHVLRKYFETHNMVGLIPPEIQAQFPEVAIKNKEIWQIFASNPDAKYNAQAVGKVTGIDTNCFAVIIKNAKVQSKKILIFQFDFKDRPKLLFDSAFPSEFDGISLLSVRRKIKVKEGTNLKLIQLRTPFFLCGYNSAFSEQKKKIIYYDGSSFRFEELLDNFKGY